VANLIFLVLLVVLAVAPWLHGAAGPGGQGLISGLVALATALWIAYLLIGRETRIHFSAISAPVLVLVTYGIVRYAMTEIESVARPHVLAAVTTGLYFLLMMNFVRRRWHFTAIVWTVVVVGTLQVFLGFWQTIGGWPVARHAAQGTFADATNYAIYLHLVSALALAYFFFSRRGTAEKTVFAFAGLAAAAGLALSQAYGYWAGWFAAAVVLGVYLLRKRGWRFRWAVAGGATLLVVAASGWLALTQLQAPGPDDRALTVTSNSALPSFSRRLWTVTQGPILLGIGAGMTPWRYPGQAQGDDVTAALGNEYLGILAEYGVVGAGALLWGGIVFALSAVLLLRQRAARYSSATLSNRYAFAVGGLAAFAAIAVDAAFGCGVRVGANLITTTGILAATLACGFRHHGDPEQKPPPLGQQGVMRLKGIARVVLVLGLTLFWGVLLWRMYATYPSYLLARLAQQKAAQLSWAGAESFATRAFRLDPRNFARAAAVGDILAVRATWITAQREAYAQRALRWYDTAITLNPHAADLFVKKARLLDLLGQQKNAEGCLHQAIETVPTHPGYHIEIGLHYQRWGNISNAIRSYQRAVALDPANPLPAHQLRALLAPGT
jgi:tetratricopeptide (TPR) repeat protein